MFNMQKMLKQAQQMQKKMGDVQEELANIEVEGIAGAGVVNVKVNAKNEFISIKIKPEAINPENPSEVDEDTIEMLEDLITSAIKDANSKADKISESKMSALTGGMNIPGMPGMF
ncbi:MAG: YbaB/EbfC family nucleoid-associated protein [Candidatus Gastranaerophilales bacterium]|nr:YbaB/EbfC family nucleoid-associated protein [Candidatus Gastranaerophilales bacterium]